MMISEWFGDVDWDEVNALVFGVVYEGWGHERGYFFWKECVSYLEAVVVVFRFRHGL